MNTIRNTALAIWDVKHSNCLILATRHRIFRHRVDEGSGPRTITNSQLVAALGSETDFKLRAWFVRSGLRSLNYDEVTVRKV